MKRWIPLTFLFLAVVVIASLLPHWDMSSYMLGVFAMAFVRPSIRYAEGLK